MRPSLDKPLPPREAGYPRECAYCFPRLEFFDSSELARHLRSIHATKEGGSYVCRYGENNVCQKLPLEGVSDVDYEAHIRRFHTQNVNGTDTRQISRTESMNSVSTTKSFTLNSFTQNLSAVLSDPGRSRSEVTTFFTRHWGDAFVLPASIAQSRLIPPVNSQQFVNYIRNTAKTYKKYRAARRQLQRLQSSGEDQQRGHTDDLPMLFMNPKFSLTDPQTFRAIFTIPSSPEVDPLSQTLSGKSFAAATPDEVDGTLTPGSFRDYMSLHNRLEILHDVVDSRLAGKLVTKKESFWTVVDSYGGLHQELADAIQNVAKVRTNFKKVSTLICGRTAKIMQLYEKREQKRRLLAKLHDISCLRDAQPMVQMMLNQSDYPRAIECIETSQNVLNNDMKGVYCFRHLGPQLQELYDMIGKIMHEDFVSLIQKELGAKPDAGSLITAEGELSSVTMGLIQMRKYMFINVIREEISEAVKSCMRQVVKNQIITSGLDFSNFDPTLVQLGDSVRRLKHDQFITCVEAVTASLFQFCVKCQALQDMILELCNRADKSGDRNSLTPEPSSEKNAETENTESATEDSTTTSESTSGLTMTASSSSLVESGSGETTTSTTATNSNSREGGEQKTSYLHPSADVASLISVEIHSHAQLKKSVSLIAEFANNCAQTRLSRLLVARFKELAVMDQTSQQEMVEILLRVRSYQRQCVEQGWHRIQTSSTGQLADCLQRLTNFKLRL
ncbi:hypothetical protein WR25_23777 [Diploscapter pachys]|uniref:Vacuolar protein sorting-associated protein 54 N-terminal domain-containing protein n=1 Tax=Diploscapter pachys TaxID=2018661 RepID=A0A2A2JML5_9BILA|nr:hypothetical protein WR25_23777 [Diploscapter pachys]